MTGLNDWIVEPEFFKTYFSKGPGFADVAAKGTRSVARRGMAHQSEFSAFAWKI